MKLKKFASVLLALVMMLALATPAYAAVNKDGTLQGIDKATGNSYQYSKDGYEGNKGWSSWSDVIFLGDASKESTNEEVSAWHLVVAGGHSATEVKSMELTFENGSYTWDGKTFSKNGGDNINGWIVVAPKDWGDITYGKIDLQTVFTISGYYKAGTPIPGDETGETSTSFTLYKYVDEFGTLSSEQFDFKFYRVDENGEKILIDSPTLEYADGVYSYNFGSKLEDGSYVIEEVLTADQVNRYVEGKTLEFNVINGEADFGENGPSITNETKTVVEFAKTVDGAVPTEDFQFDLYQGDELIKENAFTVSTDYDTYTATFSPKLPAGYLHHRGEPD